MGVNTTHKLFPVSSCNTSSYILDKSVNLVVTSPPYPMVEMWNECLAAQSEKVRAALEEQRFEDAFEAMHRVLDRTWEDVDRVLMPGGVVCINIGDATKNCDGQFKLFSNHTRVINKFLAMGYDVLPDIHWRKPTNAPNKFMGSGMYPPCAYVTYEHEYILVLRKGANRQFSNAEKENRHRSAYFWEERNVWFSDLWELPGTAQRMKKDASRARSAAFPFELSYRLVNMYSLKGDLVYDPFAGTGTVARAAMASERNSVGVDIDPAICEQAVADSIISIDQIREYISQRIKKHSEYIDNLPDDKKENLYSNNYHNFPVKTRQETDIQINMIDDIINTEQEIICTYKKE